MNWLLLGIPFLGVIGVVVALPLVRKFAPLERSPRVGNAVYPGMASGEVIAVSSLAQSVAGYGKVTVKPKSVLTKRSRLGQERSAQKAALKKKA